MNLTDAELKRSIISAKSKLGKKLVILGHHYQREEVIEFADFKGDSFGLSKIASEQKDAEFIVFCGVRFMAEAARILARPSQRVFHPEFSAGCPMADMADIDKVEEAWEELAELVDIKRVVPVAYMNTSAELKAFCGRNGGLICTSSNACKAFEWAFKHGDKIFFFPDEHLGRNTARRVGIGNNPPIPPLKKGGNLLVPPFVKGGEGGFKDIRIILWPGYCHVHTFFTLEQVNDARKKYPACKIIVHPECREEVVIACDEAASTEGICKFVAIQPKGTTVVIGTEINLVSRLAHENPDKNIVPLARSLCPNMFKISLRNLCETLEKIIDGRFENEVMVPQEIQEDARVALQRMLDLK